MARGPWLLVSFALSACESASTPAPLGVLLFSRTEGYRHEAIEPAADAIRALPGLRVRRTEEPAELVRALPDSDVVVFLMTSGDVLDAPEQDALEAHVRRGGGFVGVHSAADTEYDWPFYGMLTGAWFKDHPAIQRARLHVERALSPRLDFLPESWEREDEWYNFRDNPRAEPAVRVLMTLDESSYQGGNMGPDHPIAWCRELDAGRSFFTGLGHTLESWQDPLFMQHLAAGLRWAGRR
jgi:type 1 glutamine amidotransferase